MAKYFTNIAFMPVLPIYKGIFLVDEDLMEIGSHFLAFAQNGYGNFVDCSDNKNVMRWQSK